VKSKIAPLLAFIALSSVPVFSQDIDLFAQKTNTPTTDITTGIFKSTRIINGHSIENVGAGVLDFRILHRFGPINQGGYNLFGLDQATMRMGLDYGITKRLMVGIGRSTFEKQFDGLFYQLFFFKVKKSKKTEMPRFPPKSFFHEFYSAHGNLDTVQNN
jgi:hypothetical protein